MSLLRKGASRADPMGKADETAGFYWEENGFAMAFGAAHRTAVG